jgi:hypothetical protein
MSEFARGTSTPESKARKSMRTSHRDETRKSMQALAHQFRLHRHHRVAAGNRAAERISFVVESIEFRVVQPRLLDEFELAHERCVDRQEQQPLLDLVSARG